MANAVLLSVLGISLYTDIRYRKIYNAILFPGILAAFGYYGLTGGLEGFLFSLQGFLLGMGLFLLPFIMGGLGAGDVKLLGAVGALKGTEFVFHAFLATALMGGLLAVLVLVKERRLFSTLRQMGYSFYFFLTSRAKVNYLNHRNITSEGSFPYGVAIVLGTLFSFYWMR